MKKNLIMKNKKVIETIFKNKELYHKQMADLPFEEKIRIVVKLQKLANEIKSIKGEKKGRVWAI